MQQWWLWWRGFAAALICSKVVVVLRCCSGGDSTAMVVRCLRSPMEVLLSCVAMEEGSNRWHCSLHLVRRSQWRDDGGPHLDVRSRFAQIKCRLWICVDGERCRCYLGGCRSRGCCGALLRRAATQCVDEERFCVGCRWWLTVFLLQKLLQCSGALRRRRRNCGGRKVCFRQGWRLPW
ncbi:hypothetical protein DEO72_LG7g1635 [Vigna unguiculata]|uniref:Secreted protein n=1 Tax=Vigna unguiculata TaxID=3917 RepID=A0A4D6MKR8_VIGUN|nr:hypothetical protein DEO72_LG7g1635 [Vigna unguiculata]